MSNTGNSEPNASGVRPTPQTLDVSPAFTFRNRPKTFRKRFLALTARRQEVAMLAAEGLSNRKIAEKLDLTEGTVKIHLHEIYKILDLHSRIELAISVGALPRVKTRFNDLGGNV